jgi:hypothetical protein
MSPIIKIYNGTLEREAAFWLVSEIFIFISAKMLPPPQKKNRGWSFRGSIKKKRKMVIHRNVKSD